MMKRAAKCSRERLLPQKRIRILSYGLYRNVKRRSRSFLLADLASWPCQRLEGQSDGPRGHLGNKTLRRTKPTSPMVIDASQDRSAVLTAQVGLTPYTFHSERQHRLYRGLPGTHAVLYDPQGVITRLHLNRVGTPFSKGQATEAKGPFQIISISGYPAYRFVFPSTPQ